MNGAASRGDDRETISTTNNARSAFTTASTQASGFGFGACTVGLQSGIDSITGGAQAVIKTGFVAKAESACMAASRQFDEIIEPSGPREVRSYFDKVEAVFTKLVSDIKALAVAPGDEPTVSEMVGALERTNAKGAELFDAIAGNDQARAAALNRELSTLNTAANAKLDGYGLGQCGSNFGAV